MFSVAAARLRPLLWKEAMPSRKGKRKGEPEASAHRLGRHGLLTGAFTATTSFGDAARGWRGGGVAFGQPIFRGDDSKTNVSVVERIRREVAEPRGVSVSQIALAWVLGHPAISTALAVALGTLALTLRGAPPI